MPATLAAAAMCTHERPEVGDEVILPATGERGTVLMLHDDDLPFKVQLASGRADWFAASAVTLSRRAPLHVGDDVFIRDTGERGSVIMVHDDELPFKVALVNGRVDWFRHDNVLRSPTTSPSRAASAAEPMPSSNGRGPDADCSRALTFETVAAEEPETKPGRAQSDSQLRDLEVELQRVKAQHKADVARLCAQLHDRETALRRAEEEAYRSRIAVLEAENRAARAARLESDTKMRISLLEDSLVSLTSPDGVDLESAGERAKERLHANGSSLGRSAGLVSLRRGVARTLRGVGLSARRCFRCRGRAMAREV